MIKIRQAQYDDIPKIMKFIDEHWKKGHIMGNDRTMFEFQHVRDKEVFYIIAEDDIDGSLYGSMGYIPMAEHEWSCMSTVMIQALKNPENRMLGQEMSQYFAKNMHCYNLFSVSIEKRYAAIISAMGGFIGKLNHYYRLGRNRDFKIAKIADYKKIPIMDMGGKLIPLKTFSEFTSLANLNEIHHTYPRRTPAYIEHRYYQHPYYDYKLWGIQGEQGIRSILVAREEFAEGACILRIVDFLGRDEELSLAGKALDKIITQGDYEYIDFYCYGIEDSILQDAGFSLRDDKDENIIPNYFDPFERKNVDINFHSWFSRGIHVYRGFGDQDRPNHAINQKKEIIK